MDLETQVEEMDVGVEVEMPRVVDLNLATAEDLQSLPGIGPSLARRIVAYREERGDFRSPEELTAVPGIGRAAYERLADVLVAAPPGPLPPPVAEELVLEELLGPAPAVPEAPALPEVAPPEAEPEAEEAVVVEEKPPAAEEAPPPPQVETVAPPPAPVPRGEPVRRGSLSWLWSSLLGGLLGMLFALLVFSGINGSLDLSNSRAVLGVQNRMDALTAEMNSLRGDINGLRQRLDTLEGLTARMDKAEAAVDTLRQEVGDLDQRAGTLETEVTSVSEDVATMQTESERVTTFFGRLQALLQDVFGEEAAVEPMPESPVATPTPTQ
jgi:competence ComEA-like helix-hairpin-helix protein